MALLLHCWCLLARYENDCVGREATTLVAKLQKKARWKRPLPMGSASSHIGAGSRYQSTWGWTAFGFCAA